jgi:hypothetical protein
MKRTSIDHCVGTGTVRRVNASATLRLRHTVRRSVRLERGPAPISKLLASRFVRACGRVRNGPDLPTRRLSSIWYSRLSTYASSILRLVYMEQHCKWALAVLWNRWCRRQRPGPHVHAPEVQAGPNTRFALVDPKLHGEKRNKGIEMRQAHSAAISARAPPARVCSLAAILRPKCCGQRPQQRRRLRRLCHFSESQNHDASLPPLPCSLAAALPVRPKPLAARPPVALRRCRIRPPWPVATPRPRAASVPRASGSTRASNEPAALK